MYHTPSFQVTTKLKKAFSRKIVLLLSFKILQIISENGKNVELTSVYFAKFGASNQHRKCTGRDPYTFPFKKF